jgi:hypothetical protein
MFPVRRCHRNSLWAGAGEGMSYIEAINFKASDRCVRYLLNRPEDFSNIEYKVLMSQKEQGFLECFKVTCNGNPQLIYDVTNYKPLSLLAARLSSEEFFRIISELYKTAEFINNSGFMKNDHVVLSTDRIYVEPVTKKVYLIYLPVNIVSEEKAEGIEAAIKKIILNIILNHNNLYDNNIQELYNDIKAKDLSLDIINMKIQNGEYNKTEQIPDNPPESNSYNSKRMTLISNNSPEPIIMRIDMDEFLIGKKVSNVYGLIRNYPTISREHCKITYRSGHYYITDLNSANGTYINEKRIPGNVECPLNRKDKLRLANLVFDIQET